LYPFGKNPVGILTYDRVRNVAGQMMNPGRTRFAGDDKPQGTEEAMRISLSGYEAYFGPYEISEDEDAVIHTVEGALFPNWVGGIQKRFFRIDGNMLELKTGEMDYMGSKFVATVTWARKATGNEEKSGIILNKSTLSDGRDSL
jgi:hypothetical protein